MRTLQADENSENQAPSEKGEKLVLTGLQRFASMSSSFGMGKREMTQQVLAEEAQRMTFHPHILRKSSARPARSYEEMSEGDRLRREVWVVRCCSHHPFPPQPPTHTHTHILSPADQVCGGHG